MSASPQPAPNLPAFAPAAWREAMADGAWHDWRWHQQHRLGSVAAILEVLGDHLALAPSVRRAMQEVEARVTVAVTPYYLSLADPKDPRDPVLPQVLPDPAELEDDGVPDPFEEEGLQVAPGVVHRYPDRALFLLTNYCATLCRHCMRRREWGRRFSRLTDAQVDESVAAIAARPEIRDVLLSGGDPLNLAPAYLGRVLRELRRHADLDCLRLGSRVPVTLPQRVDEELCRQLEPAAPLFLNTHFNHAREVTPEAVQAVRRLGRAGVVVSNQAVLLRGVNDSPEDQLALARALLRAGVRAYYLHHCDPVQGVRHLRVGLARGRELVRGLGGKVSGLAIPRLIVDLPGGRGKVVADGPDLLDVDGDRHVYRSPLDGGEVAVDGSEGSFGGVGSWAVESPQGPRYIARPS